MKTYKYKLIEIDHKSSILSGKVDASAIEETLNKLGQNGWEVVSSFSTNQINGYTRKIVYTLKQEE